MQNKVNEIYISVDIETAGPNPGTYSLLSIGACSVFEPGKSFYVEIQPLNDNFIQEAIDVCGLDMEKLKKTGLPAKEAMTLFAQWANEITPSNSRALFVAVNAPFDWMFVNDYFHRFIGHNPFGHNALDIKAFYMGMEQSTWSEASMGRLTKLYLENQALTHNALQDAIDQAKIFHELLNRKPISFTF